ncbi:MAG: sensor histidine kinase [Candidatus Saccharimonadales bacterium]
MFRSATFKLTMWYLAIVMAISLIFSAVLYNITTHELDRGLHSESERIYTQFPVFDNDPRFKPAENIDEGAHRILLKLIGFNLIVLVGAGYASYLLARRTLEPIEAAHEQQKRFTADVSHELRTPLTALKMESEVSLMNPKATAKELRSTLTSNLEEVSKMEALINNLLRLTRLEADELQQDFKPIKVQTIFDEAIKQVESQATNQKISIESGQSNQIVLGDRESLVQLVVILLDNAIKYSEPGGEVTLVSKQKDDLVKISVEDHGKGIERGDLDRVFDRFFRVDESRNKMTHDGHGLGLSIAKMIADIHHGVITIASKPGEGTTATVELPAEVTLKQ